MGQEPRDIEQQIEETRERMGDTVEALLLACYSGFRVVEVPVRMRPRAGGVPSNRNLKLIYHYFRVLLMMATTAPIRRRPGPWRASLARRR